MLPATAATVALVVLTGAVPSAAQEPLPADWHLRGEALPAPAAAANEQGFTALTWGPDGHLYAATTGRAARLLRYDVQRNEVATLDRLEGPVGFSYGLAVLPDGSLVAGTQADSSGLAPADTFTRGGLYRFAIEGEKVHRELLAEMPPGEGVYALAHLEPAGQIVGNTWPEGHFFVFDLQQKQLTVHEPIAGHRTFEIPRYAEKVNFGTDQNVRYPRQVSRCVAVLGNTAYTGGADGFLYRYDAAGGQIQKTTLRLPAVLGREPWTSLDAAVAVPAADGQPTRLYGGTSEGFLFELRLPDEGEPTLRSFGKPSAQTTIHGLAIVADCLLGFVGHDEGMPRSFSVRLADGHVQPGGIPRVDGTLSMTGFRGVVADSQGNLYAGQRDRIGRLVRFRVTQPAQAKPRPPRQPRTPLTEGEPEIPGKIPCRVVFAPLGTTTEASGYTAIEVGRDGYVYVGTARYGDYGWLLRFPGTSLLGKDGQPDELPLFMEKVVSMRELTGERLTGINTQGKIHTKMVVGADGRIWFGSKQAHEVFDTRPEYGEDPLGYPGGHLCYYDPSTGFARSLGILKKQEGLMAGAIDDKRGKLYWRSEPKNHFLVYDLQTLEVRDAGHIGGNGRYMVCDRHGAVYTTGSQGILCRYDPQTLYVEDLAVVMEDGSPPATPYVLALGPNGKLYGAGYGHPWIMEYDIDRLDAQSRQVTARNAAPAAPPGMLAEDIHAGTFGLDGCFYYPLNSTGPLEPGGPPVRGALRIRRFDPRTGVVRTVGAPRVEGLDEAKVRHTYNRTDKYVLDHMQGAAVGPDGTLYLLDIYPQLNVAVFPQLTAPK